MHTHSIVIGLIVASLALLIPVNTAAQSIPNNVGPQNATGTKWSRQLVDPGSVAIEDLTAGDLNGDGRVDLVAVGRATHNVKIYWNENK